MDFNNIELKNLFETLRLAIFRCTTSPKAKFVEANQNFKDLLEIKAKSVSQMFVSGIFENKKRFQEIRKEIRAKGAVKNVEVLLKKKNNKTIWCVLSGIVVKDDKGKAKWLDIIVEDISSRKLYEQQLIESKDLFSTVFQNTAAAITVTDINGKLVAWNPFAEIMLGMGKEELFNKNVKELYTKKESKRMKGLDIRKRGIVENIETQVCRKDGSILDVSVSISVLRENEGQVKGTVGIFRDITAQKAAERKIKESEDKIRVILDNSAASIILTDEEERIVSWNKFTEELLGRTAKDLYSLPVKEIYPKEEWRKIREANIRKIGSKHHMETKALKKSGEIFDIDLSINILRDANGEIVGSVGIMQDITRQKRLQESLVQAKLAAEEASSAKSLFLANMSHEVRTPMNAVMGMIDLTLETHLTPEQRDNLEVAKEAADNLLGLINDILDLSRVEAGKITLETIEMNLHNVVRNVVKGLSVIARDKNLELKVIIDENVPEMIEGDPVRLRQVLINLINNAIKFTAKGKVVVLVEVEVMGKDDSMLRFSVIDEGIGIPKDRQDKIFEVFTQAEASTVRRFGGTGLGLAISKRLVEMMGGRIWVDSEEGEGSKFRFTGNFKLVKTGSLGLTATSSSSGSQELSLADLKGLRVLLAEDNLVNQKIAARMLEKMGFQVTCVEDGKKAAEFADKSNIELILMDVQMPVLDGLEAAQLIRKNEEKTGKHMPIIALTARAMSEDRQRCQAAGMDGYASKPIDRNKLIEEIISVIKKGKKNE